MARKAKNIDELPADAVVDTFGFPVAEADKSASDATLEAAPVQRILGGYLPIAGMPGWYTREITLRQEIELADMAADLQNLGSGTQKPSAILRAAIPVAKLIIFRRNADGDMVAVTEDDLLDNFKAVSLLKIVQSVTGAQPVEDRDSPTKALPISG